MRTDERSTEPGYEDRNLVCVLRNALREADACAGYALEAGDDRLAEFFRETQKTNAEIAERAREMLDAAGDGQWSAAGIRSGVAPAEGDPGDLSPGQDVA